jgi:hypothetical protein
MTDEQRSQTGWIGVPKWVVILGRALRLAFSSVSLLCLPEEGFGLAFVTG